MSAVSTHAVTNQPPPLTGHNAFRGDPLLLRLTHGLDANVLEELDRIGRFVQSAEAQDLARLANENPPRLRTHDRQGHRLDQVEFHPAWHALMRRSVSYGLSSSVWEDIARGAGEGHLARAARFYLMAGLETGHLCPLTMTSASFAALMVEPRLAREWGPRLSTRKYDLSHRPPDHKSGLLIGMGMTEKQGGSDLSGMATRAEPAGGGLHRLTGHKWFLSAPMSDAFVVLARTDAGITCFLVPRILSGGEPNRLHFQRLKDKLGNRSNASAEVEFGGAVGQRVGEEGGGLRAILEMVTLTRLDCALASAGIMRAGLAEAVHHARRRKVRGGALIDQPLMTRVLADMAIDVAAATALSFRLARAYDAARGDAGEGAFARAMTPVVKYWVCKAAPPLLAEAMECLGGNGYVEEMVLARHYREAPVNSIWEGSGNVMALDLLRVFKRSEATLEAILDGLARDLGARADKTINVIRAALSLAAEDEGAARIATEQLALAAAAAELERLGMGGLAGAFADTRLGGAWRATYGMLDGRFDARTLLDALYPPVN
ncbi:MULTISPECIES: acyl-CoA dehydrogenase family protein [unclassified Roseitalea]|uniref:acyl-CoA dehydrogenase family protein n=1 Tax=unclassified Roseitalea TaxID=2639107 RepID=UPI00273FEA9C|nr:MULTISPECIES: acyl-CoA dehydrogenase family protein [unclassified Roseitalea]